MKKYTISKFNQGPHLNITIRLNGEVIAYYNYPTLNSESYYGMSPYYGSEAYHNLPEGEVDEDQVTPYLNFSIVF